MTLQVKAEILIHSGLHQFQHGQITSIDTATEIPFAHVRLRGSKGQFLERSGAYVPLKYCIEIDDETAKAMRAAARAVRKQLRAAEKAAHEAQTEIDPAPMEW
jgi:hypothetical protein